MRRYGKAPTSRGTYPHRGIYIYLSEEDIPKVNLIFHLLVSSPIIYSIHINLIYQMPLFTVKSQLERINNKIKKIYKLYIKNRLGVLRSKSQY